MKKLLFIAGILALLAGCDPSGDSKLLRLQYRKGNMFDIKCKRYTESSDGQKSPPYDVVKAAFRIDSTSGDSLYQVTSKLLFVYAPENVKGPDNQRFVSDADITALDAAKRKRFKEFSGFMNANYSLEMNSLGKITGTGELKVIAGPPPPSGIELIDLDLCQPVLPAEPVSVGDVWTDSRQFKTASESRKFDYKLSYIRDSVIHVALTGTIEKPADGSITNVSGEYQIHERTNELLSAQIKLEDQKTASARKLVYDVVANKRINDAPFR